MHIRIVVLAPVAVLRRLERVVPQELTSLSHAKSAAEAFEVEDFDLLIADAKRMGRRPAELCARLRALPGAPEAIVCCEQQDPADRASLLAAGCLAVIDSDVDDPTLTEILRALILRRRETSLQRARTALAENRHSLDEFSSRSPVMQQFLAMARKVVDSDVSLLVLGETGVGKERLARSMHDEGPQRNGPFVAVNAGALPEHLLESELFGHEQGAFTGADRSRRGYFELASGGTLFLDEIADIPLSLQVKLLRALQERKIRRLGGESERVVDVRLICATNNDLPAEVAARRFRADLYYRVAVVTLTIPPLRERREDIPPLVESHVEAAGVRLRKRDLSVSQGALAALQEYAWPGNVRELLNVLERAVLLCDGTQITTADLPEQIAQRALRAGSSRTHAALMELPYSIAVERLVGEFEVEYFSRLLRSTRGRVGDTARLAGITPRALYDKMIRLGLQKEAFRGSVG